MCSTDEKKIKQTHTGYDFRQQEGNKTDTLEDLSCTENLYQFSPMAPRVPIMVETTPVDKAINRLFHDRFPDIAGLENHLGESFLE